ncbi:MAG: hypothetical protein KME50_24670 [Nostoc desertorum CM1-VF14]|nr:hypothetical protein [Nostoc desertorum CM1-VF14]
MEEEGFDAIAVENGLVGVQQAQEYLPDLIISDIMMPKRRCCVNRVGRTASSAEGQSCD